MRAFLAESEMVNNQLELPEELLKAPKIINESARFVFDNIKDKYREAIPASDFSEFDTQLYFNNISESGLFDDVEVRGEKLFTITKSGKKKINKDLLDSFFNEDTNATPFLIIGTLKSSIIMFII